MQITNIDRIRDVLTPSISSGALVAVVSVLSIGYSVVKSYGAQTSLQSGIFAAQNVSSPTYHQVIDNLAKNEVVSNAPLFLFWLAVGVIVYMIAVNVIKGFGNGVNLVEELEYVNIRPSTVIRYEVIKAVIRAVVLGSWLLYLHVFTHVILPFVLALAFNAHRSSSLIEIGHIVLALVVMAIAVHMHIVLLRLLLLKRRVFTMRYDIS